MISDSLLQSVYLFTDLNADLLDRPGNDTLNRCQRFLRAAVVRPGSDVEQVLQVRSSVPYREFTGWMGRWEKAKTQEVPLMNKLADWFSEHQPAPQPPVILHNDFYLHNVMVGAVNHGEIVGVFDWEMSTIGDPLVDLGIVMNYWRDKNDPPELLGTSQGEAHTLRPGFLTRPTVTVVVEISRYRLRPLFGVRTAAVAVHLPHARRTPHLRSPLGSRLHSLPDVGSA